VAAQKGRCDGSEREVWWLRKGGVAQWEVWWFIGRGDGSMGCVMAQWEVWWLTGRGDGSMGSVMAQWEV
jgi:hypothetical protein